MTRSIPPILLLLALVGCDMEDDAEFCATYADLECTQRLDVLLSDTGEIGLIHAQLAELPSTEELADLNDSITALQSRVTSLEEALGMESEKSDPLDVVALTGRVAELEVYLEQDTGFAGETISDHYQPAGDYLTSDDLDDYVTELELLAEDYAYQTDVDDLQNQVDTGLADHELRLQTIEGDYVVSSDLASYASQSALSSVDTRVFNIEADYLISSDLSGYAVQTDLDAVDTRVSTIEADYLTSSDLSGYAKNTDLTSLDSRVSSIEGEYISDSDLNDGLELLFLDAIWTIGSGGDHNTVAEALDVLDGYRIAPDGSVTLELIGNVSEIDTVSISHPDADRLTVTSDSSGPYTWTLAGDTGLFVTNGTFFGGVELVAIDASGTTDYAVYASRNAAIALTSVEINDAPTGIYVHSGATLFVDDVVIDAPSYDGLVAEAEGAVLAGGTLAASATAGELLIDGAGVYGINVRHGAELALEGAVTATGSGSAAIYAERNADVSIIGDLTIDGDSVTTHAMQAQQVSRIVVQGDISATSNTSAAVLTGSASHVYVDGTLDASASGNSSLPAIYAQQASVVIVEQGITVPGTSGVDDLHATRGSYIEAYYAESSSSSTIYTNSTYSAQMWLYSPADSLDLDASQNSGTKSDPYADGFVWEVQ